MTSLWGWKVRDCIDNSQFWLEMRLEDYVIELWRSQDGRDGHILGRTRGKALILSAQICCKISVFKLVEE